MAAFTFTVEGRAPFPYDMLRYDVCWPRTQEDTAAMERLTRTRPHAEARKTERITLATNGHPPTVARWRSFGWTVVEGSV